MFNFTPAEIDSGMQCLKDGGTLEAPGRYTTAQEALEAATAFIDAILEAHPELLTEGSA